MVAAVFGGFVDWCGGGGALSVGRAVGEGYELGEGVGTVGAAKEGGVADLLGAGLGALGEGCGGAACGEVEGRHCVCGLGGCIGMRQQGGVVL